MRLTRLIARGVLLACIAFPVTAYAGNEVATAKPAPKKPPAPCVERDEFAQFDFWVGSWQVHDATGEQLYGTNRIEKMPGGCVLLERWRGRGGASGISMNYFDSAAQQWVQVWSGSGGSQLSIRGGLRGKSMLLKGMIHYVDSGKSAHFRGTWTPLEDGRVRQFFEESPDQGKSWKPWFEGFYSRVAE